MLIMKIKYAVRIFPVQTRGAAAIKAAAAALVAMSLAETTAAFCSSY